ncbi:hypothetical protein SUDANB95_07120 [Actinosynnema sp. ALI-1.44]
MRSGPLVLGVLGALTVFGFASYANHDRPELIDDSAVAAAVERACAVMARDVRAAVGDPVAVIRARNDAVVAMVDAVRALGPDRIARDEPTAAWLADWRALVDARARYADDLAAGRAAVWTPPLADGVPVGDRLASVGVDCAVPAEVADPR